jgi:hypothetical protein
LNNNNSAYLSQKSRTSNQLNEPNSNSGRRSVQEMVQNNAVSLTDGSAMRNMQYGRRPVE